MARPRKRRNVCCLPENSRFGPIDMRNNQKQFIIMSVDEYETIRLIDLEGLTQEQCADQMHIARTTVQRIYSDARRKIAKAIVNGRVLRIEGGNYKLCNGIGKACGGRGCGRHELGRGFIKDNEEDYDEDWNTGKR